MNNFDPKKPVQTRSGLKVVIYCTDAPGDYPIHGRVESKGGYDITHWSKDGTHPCCKNAEDLINTPEVVEGWMNIYPNDFKRADSVIWPTKAMADHSQLEVRKRIACIPIKFTVGQGL